MQFCGSFSRSVIFDFFVLRTSSFITHALGNVCTNFGYVFLFLNYKTVRDRRTDGRTNR